MRIALLCTELAAYYLTCFKALQETGKVELLLVHWPVNMAAPYTFNGIPGVTKVYNKSAYSPEEVRKYVVEFQPEIVYMSGWNDSLYNQIARKLKSRSLIIAGLDNQWRGTVRQRLASFLSRWYLKSMIDVMWVPGNRQKVFAKKMGYSGKSCWEGLLTCDVDRFSEFGRRGIAARTKSFLYVGRFAQEKGIDILAEAYLEYRNMVSNPWGLVCVGAGKYKPDSIMNPVIKHREFIQPEEMPSLMSEHTCLVLPSYYEPWGLVIQEAVAAGLPVVCTSACGAADHFVNNGRNGWIIQQGSSEALRDVMIRMHGLKDEEWNDWHDESLRIAPQFTPQKWTHTLLQGMKAYTKING
jgi:glycosyltransferase involved in cell wall biosynthesis